MIEFIEVSKTFGDKVVALDDVSFSINDGEIFGIIGYSGAGKSTLLRCINLLEKPSKGSVLIDGISMTELTPKKLRTARRKIGMIFQHFHLMPSRTVFENIAFPLRKSGLSKAQIRERVRNLLELVEIPEKENAYPRELSGGQKQRVAIARALANEPSILLCDEATSALDPQTTQSILELLKDLNKKLGITIVIISHEMAVVKEICHKIAVMEKAKLAELGDVFEIFTEPKEEITQTFMNSVSNLHKIHRLIELDAPIVRLAEDEILVKLSYTEQNTNEPMISYVSSAYNVSLNIIFADIELVNDAPIGGTIAIMRGSRSNLTLACEYFIQKNVKVEVIRDGRNY